MQVTHLGSCFIIKVISDGRNLRLLHRSFFCRQVTHTVHQLQHVGARAIVLFLSISQCSESCYIIMLCCEKKIFSGPYTHHAVYIIHIRNNNYYSFNTAEYIMMLQWPLLDKSNTLVKTSLETDRSNSGHNDQRRLLAFDLPRIEARELWSKKPSLC